MIPASAIVSLKALIFELEDMEHFGALPVLMTLQAIYVVQLKYMNVQRTKSVVDKANFADLSKLTEITVPKLTADNDEIFNTALCSVV